MSPPTVTNGQLCCTTSVTCSLATLTTLIGCLGQSRCLRPRIVPRIPYNQAIIHSNAVRTKLPHLLRTPPLTHLARSVLYFSLFGFHIDQRPYRVLDQCSSDKPEVISYSLIQVSPHNSAVAQPVTHASPSTVSYSHHSRQPTTQLCCLFYSSG